MHIKHFEPTPYPDVNVVVLNLLSGVQNILGDHLVGMYLEGSLACGDFDQDSDIDFVAVTDDEVTGAVFSALDALHEQIAGIDSWCATQLEGSYISRRAIRRYDSANALHPNIERGKGKRLKMAQHNQAWIIHRHILREHGIALMGPAPRSLIDPVTPNGLKRAAIGILQQWASQLSSEPSRIQKRGYQSFAVLTLCRILYTLDHGAVVTKPVASHWARKNLGEDWVRLIERAWAGRHDPGSKTPPEDVHCTLEFIRYALKRIDQLDG